MSINHNLVNATYDEIQSVVAMIEAIVIKAHDFTETERETIADYLYEIAQEGSPIAEEIATSIAQNINI